MTREDIESVIRLIPTVGVAGSRGEICRDPLTRRFETWDKYLSRQKADQIKLFDQGPILSLICVWCSAVPRRKTVDRSETSYGYKHHAERNFGTYVQNGEFVTAAVFSGIPFKLISDSDKVHFGITTKRSGPYVGDLRVTTELPGEPVEWWSAIHNTDGELLWRSVIAMPGDSLSRDVLADWLEERGHDGWANWLREITHVVTSRGSRKRR